MLSQLPVISLINIYFQTEKSWKSQEVWCQHLTRVFPRIKPSHREEDLHFNTTFVYQISVSRILLVIFQNRCHKVYWVHLLKRWHHIIKDENAIPVTRMVTLLQFKITKVCVCEINFRFNHNFCHTQINSVRIYM